jgi:site-specific DNA recombinase
MDTQQIGKISGDLVFVEERVKYVLYARKSTESDEMQALSIDSQIKEMLQLAEREKLQIIEIKREAHSAKASGQRPVFQEILQGIREGKYTGVLTWAPDRLSRNAGDLGSLVDLMDQKRLIHIQTFTQKFTNDPSQKFLLMILCSQAKLENDNKSLNVKRGLRARVEMGLWPCRPPTGYVSTKRTDKKCVAIFDNERSEVVKKIFERIGYDNWSGMKTYKWLAEDLKFKTETNKLLSMGNFYRLIENTFYHGVFEFPRGSGNWYKGAHEPLITKELFDLVQRNINDNNYDTRSKQKEFAFTKLFSCNICGSGITADEKFKKLKDGSTNRHVYYKCTKTRNTKCDFGYITEENLLDQIKKYIDSVDLNKSSLREKVSKEIYRIKRFQTVLLKRKTEVFVREVDIREYVKFILEEGEIDENRNIVNCFVGKISIENKTLVTN